MENCQPDPSKFKFTNVGTSVTDTYEELLVPRIFRPWADFLLDQAGVCEGHHVLDVACGPGTVAQQAAGRAGPNGKVTGADISPEMLDIARLKKGGPNSAPIEFVESPAAPLNVPDSAFDAVMCQQGFQFFPNRVEALKEMARAVRPQGLIAIAVWGTIGKNPIWNAMHQALRASATADIADMMKAPFSLNDPKELQALCEEAGLKNIDIQGHTLSIRFEGGIAQVVRCLEATPISSKLSEDQKKTFHQELGSRLEPMLNGKNVHGASFSHIILARR